MHLLVTGASGMVGRALLQRLATEGHQVVRLVRREPRGTDELRWDPAGGQLDLGDRPIDGVVHLAGENIADGRWSAERKRAILESRKKGTELLARTLSARDTNPYVLVSASAIGYYGPRGDEPLEEDAASGTGFLAEVCRAWEEATRPAEGAGIRVVRLRIGVVLSKNGGALAKMLTPFKMGVGGKVGSGDQVMSWITLDDLVSVIVHALGNADLRGPVNATAPGAVTNAEFTRALGKALGRPTVFPMPAFAARLAFGEMADELLLSGARVRPAALLASGFRFGQPEIGPALGHVLES